VCESFINCPKTLRVSRLNEGVYEISICVSQRHNHTLNEVKHRRYLVEDFIKKEIQEPNFQQNLQKYLIENGFDEYSSRQLYNLKYNVKKKLKNEILNNH
jgi:hypothetical protein